MAYVWHSSFRTWSSLARFVTLVLPPIPYFSLHLLYFFPSSFYHWKYMGGGMCVVRSKAWKYGRTVTASGRNNESKYGQWKTTGHKRTKKRSLRVTKDRVEKYRRYPVWANTRNEWKKEKKKRTRNRRARARGLRYCRKPPTSEPISTVADVICRVFPDVRRAELGWESIAARNNLQPFELDVSASLSRERAATRLSSLFEQQNSFDHVKSPARMRDCNAVYAVLWEKYLMMLSHHQCGIINCIYRIVHSTKARHKRVDRSRSQMRNNSSDVVRDIAEQEYRISTILHIPRRYMIESTYVPSVTVKADGSYKQQYQSLQRELKGVPITIIY